LVPRARIELATP